MVGSRLGSYELLARLGEGGMGEVYRARDLRLQRDVAVKILPAAFVADPDRLARFEREARDAARVRGRSAPKPARTFSSCVPTGAASHCRPLEAS